MIMPPGFGYVLKLHAHMYEYTCLRHIQVNSQHHIGNCKRDIIMSHASPIYVTECWTARLKLTLGCIGKWCQHDSNECKAPGGGTPAACVLQGLPAAAFQHGALHQAPLAAPGGTTTAQLPPTDHQTLQTASPGGASLQLTGGKVRLGHDTKATAECVSCWDDVATVRMAPCGHKCLCR